jgi:hypothetical protein
MALIYYLVETEDVAVYSFYSQLPSSRGLLPFRNQGSEVFHYSVMKSWKFVRGHNVLDYL